MKLAFLDLPDDQVDLISTARRAEGVELVLVANADPDALALRIAEVLQIPRSHEPLDLLTLKPDRVALPSLDGPSASGLLRAGISPSIFVPFAELKPLLEAERSEEAELLRIDDWDEEMDGAFEVGPRLDAIRDALALSEDRQRLFREVLALAVSETGADAGSLMILDEEEGELRIAFANGLSNDTVRGARQKLGEGIAGTVAQSGTPLIINERVLDPRYKEGRERPRIASAMSAPVKLDGRVIGVLNVSSDRPGVRFRESDLARLTEIGAQISAILDRVVRRTRSDQDAIEFRARQTLERAFQAGVEERNDRLQAAAARLAEQIGARVVEIYTAGPEPGVLSVAASSPAASGMRTVPEGVGFVGRAIGRGETLVLTGRAAAEVDDRAPGGMELFLLPLRGAWGRGALLVERAGAGTPDAEALLRVLGRIAEYLAGLLEAAPDGSEREASRGASLLSMLSDIAPRLMVSREVDGLAVEAVGALRELFPDGLVSVRLLDPSGDLILRTAYAGDEGARERAIERDAELAAEVLGGGVPAHGETVPVRTAERVVGALGVVLPEGTARERGLAEAETAALDKLSLYVSIAWENVKALAGDSRPTHDPVTGLLAVAGLEARLQEEVKRAERYHERFLLTLCAIAEFGTLERTHGEEFSERLLREFGASLARNVREVDTVARLGGGRFAVLSPETDKDAGALLKRLDLLLPRLECVGALENPGEVRLIGRQYSYPDEIATAGELLAMIRGDR